MNCCKLACDAELEAGVGVPQVGLLDPPGIPGATPAGKPLLEGKPGGNMPGEFMFGKFIFGGFIPGAGINPAGGKPRPLGWLGIG